MDDKIFKLLEQMQANIMDKFDQVNQRFDGVEKDIESVKEDIKSMKNDIVRLENKMDDKLTALFDGYTQNTKLLEDIREEVAKHEEVIIKRVK